MNSLTNTGRFRLAIKDDLNNDFVIEVFITNLFHKLLLTIVPHLAMMTNYYGHLHGCIRQLGRRITLSKQELFMKK